ncbi:MAG: hypothetical protein K8R88_02775 [Armatimonadetes bacterium]|nr:hypothetical protein [Armatimonadota bacterium]
MMIVASILLAVQMAEQVLLPIELPNIRHIRPGPENGSYIITTNDGPTLHYWPKRIDRPPLTVKDAWTVSSYERATSWQLAPGGPIFNSKKWSTRDSNFEPTAWLGNVEVRITNPRPRKTMLMVGKRKIFPPTGQQFLILSGDGKFVVTEHLKTPNSYGVWLQLWKVSERNISFVRKLGGLWYDGGSTGTPSYLAVSSDGYVVYDSPSGGAAIEQPVLVGPDSAQRMLNSLVISGYVTLLDTPCPLGQGVLLPVVAVDLQRTDEMDLGYTETSWLVWYSAEGAVGKLLPAGFLNLIVAGPSRVQMAVRVKNGIVLRPLDLLPRGWHKIDISEAIVLKRPW